MTSTSNMNIILGQGAAVKEIHNIRKQNLELSQQFIAQTTVEQKKKDKLKVQRADDTSKIEADKDEAKKERSDGDPQDPQEENQEDLFAKTEGNLIDITV